MGYDRNMFIRRLLTKILHPHDEEKIFHKIEEAIPRYKEIENGDVIPTFEEFFKICIFLQMDEDVNLKKLYPTLHEQYLRDIQIAWIGDDMNNQAE